MGKTTIFFKNAFTKIGNTFMLLIDDQYFSKRTNFNGKVTMIANFVWASLKFVFGIFTASYFFCISALYTIGVGFAKKTYFNGLEYKMNINKANKYYARMAGILLLANLIHIVYMVRLFFYPSNFNYGMIVSISIAALSFTEVGLAIAGLIKSNRRNDLLLSGFKSISLNTALQSIVLTQIAIMSFAEAGDSSKYNALSGCIFGGMCIMITLFMFMKSYRIKKTTGITINKPQ